MSAPWKIHWLHSITVGFGRLDGKFIKQRIRKWVFNYRASVKMRCRRLNTQTKCTGTGTQATLTHRSSLRLSNDLGHSRETETERKRKIVWLKRLFGCAIRVQKNRICDVLINYLNGSISIRVGKYWRIQPLLANAYWLVFLCFCCLQWIFWHCSLTWIYLLGNILPLIKWEFLSIYCFCCCCCLHYFSLQLMPNTPSKMYANKMVKLHRTKWIFSLNGLTFSGA